jgi:hypothetical protein
MQTSTSILIAGAMLAAAVVGAASIMPGRYVLERGEQLLDSRTGDVQECVRDDEGFHCEDSLNELNAWIKEHRPAPEAAPTRETAPTRTSDSGLDRMLNRFRRRDAAQAPRDE